MAGLEFVCTYLDNVLVLTTGTWDDHLRKLVDIVLSCIAQAGLKINATKSAFGKPKIEFLGFWITRNGIKPLAKKVEAIHANAPPTTYCEQLQRFIGIINYYCDSGSAVAFYLPHLPHFVLLPPNGSGQMWNKRLLT